MINDAVITYYKAQAEKRGSLIRACRHIAKRLNHRWTADYLYLVLEGKSKPGSFLISKLNQLVAPGKPRYRRIFESLSKAQFDEWSILTMDDGREALDKAVKEKHG